jgi:hypothetical protein
VSPNPIVPSIIAMGKAICVFPLLILGGYFRPIDLARPSFLEAPVWEQYAPSSALNDSQVMTRCF